MSKFQSFATQGSFRDYQLQAPDETAKIEQETARTIRGRERAQQFLEQNNELYLRAQKLAQNQESAQREENFRLETENRKAFRDALDRDYQIQTENDRKKAAQIDQTYKQLSAFSKTAFELYGAVDQHITETQEKANAANTIIAGTTVQENIAIKGMVANLTRAEFEQQDLITRLVKEGKDVDALWTLYGRRNTRNFVNNISTIQNTANGLDSYLNQVLLNLPEGLTAEQQKIEIEKAYRTFIADSFTVDGKQLNPKLINNVAAPILNSSYNRISSELDREIKKERLETLRIDKLKGLSAIWDAGEGVQGLLTKFHTVNPSQEKREIFAEWIVFRLKSGTLTPEEATAILDTEYDGPNGQPTTWRKQFAASKEVGLINEAIRDQRRTAVNDWKLEQAELIQAVETELGQRIDEALANDGIIDKEERDALRLIQDKAPPGYESPSLADAESRYTIEAIRRTAINEEFTAKADQGRLTIADVETIQGDYQLKDKWMQIAVRQTKQRSLPENKVHLSAIDAMVAQDPRIKAAPVTGKENYTVILKQAEMRRFYQEKLELTGDPNQAFALTKDKVEKILSNPASIKNGFYADYLQTDPKSITGAKTSLKQYQQFLEAATQPGFRSDPKKALNAIGVENYTTARQAALKGKPLPTIIKQGAAAFNVTPLEFINFLARGNGEKPITLDSRVENIRRQLKPSTRRLYSRPTSKRIEAGNYINNPNSVKPTRGAFNVVQYVSNDPRFKNRSFGPIVYDPHGHGGENMHVHYEFATKEEALAAKALFESKGFRISSFIRPHDTRSAHSKGFALDVAPPLNLPYNERAELEWINSVNAVIGYNPQQ